MEAPPPKVRAPEIPTDVDWLNTPQPLPLKSLRGKFVLLEFWTFCCINCHHNIGELRRLSAKYPDALVVLGVHSAKFTGEMDLAAVRNAVARHGITYPVVNDPGRAIWSEYAVKAWPTLVLVDPEGYILSTTSGEVTAKDLAPIIDQHIAAAEAKGVLRRTRLAQGAPTVASAVAAADATAESSPMLSFPSKVLATEDGRLFVADTGNHRILQVRVEVVGEEDGGGYYGFVERTFGTGEPGLRDGSAERAQFNSPHGMALVNRTVSRTPGTDDRATQVETLYVADTENHAIRAINLAYGTVRTVAGTGRKGAGLPVPKGSDPRHVDLRSPWSVHGGEGILFIAMAGSHQIWVLIDEDRVGPFAGNGREMLADGVRENASFNQPSDITEGLEHLFIADSEASAIRAITFKDPPQVFTLVGQGLFEWGDVDGVGPEVRLQHPTGLAWGDGFVFIADSFNHKVKGLDPTTGRVETLIGTGKAGLKDGPFAKAELNEPEGLAAASGRLYIADTNNHVVRVADMALARVDTVLMRVPGAD